MEAKDLRIGDWVYDTMDGNKTPCRVILDDFKDEAEGLHIFSVFEPIPLTNEILRKNGFSEGVMYSWLNIDEHKTLEYYYHEHELREWWHGVDEWNNHKEEKELSFLCQAHNVHKFQHALRLCGLSDLADNFKIE